METATQKVLSAINRHWMEYAQPPTMRELMDEVGIASTSTIFYHVDKLLASGELLPAEKGQARAMMPPWVKKAIKNFAGKEDETVNKSLSLAGQAALAWSNDPGAPVWNGAPKPTENAQGFAAWVEKHADAVRKFLAGK